jgi:hypothetical protein
MKIQLAITRAIRPALLAITTLTLLPQISRADESGISFWVPGLFGSLAAVPQTPGWSVGAVYYHTSVAASGSAAAAREIQVGRFSPTVNVNLNVNLNAPPDLLFLTPTYTFATPVLGGQLAMAVLGIYGRNSTTLDGTLTTGFGPIAATRMGSISDSLTAFGDLYPMITLKWNAGVHNYMTYVTGDIPVGAYDPSRLSNISATAPSTAVAATPTLTRRPDMNSRASPALPIISRIPIRRFKAASISISIGVHRSFSRNRSSSVLSAMPISRYPTTPVGPRSLEASGREYSALVHSSDIFSRSETCRDI